IRRAWGSGGWGSGLGARAGRREKEEEGRGRELVREPGSWTSSALCPSPKPQAPGPRPQAPGPKRHAHHSAWLRKLQRHSIRLADGIVFGAVEVGIVAFGRAARRRQRPDAERMIRGVFRVRIDLRARDELQACSFRELDDARFAHVARGAFRIVFARLRTMLLEREDAARLQASIEIFERFFRHVVTEPAVYGPGGQDEIECILG